MMGLGNRILMVHDDAGRLQERARYFSRLGYVVTMAQTTSEAIEATTQRDFDVVEIDLTHAPAASHLRSYLEKRYRNVSVFVLAGRPLGCRSLGAGNPTRWPDRTS